jgi:hypothetical protein
MRFIIFILILFSSVCHGQIYFPAIVQRTPAQGSPLLIIFSGESNSGGYAVNSDATSDELAPRTLQILNNTSLEFEDLDIGTNNLIGHAGFTDNTTHGWELQLANRYEDGDFNRPVYLVKTGQGGTRIADWNVGATTYLSPNCWQIMQDRVNAAISEIETLTGQTPELVMFYSLGINDAIAGTNTSTWKTAVEAHFAKVRAEWPGLPIFMTELPNIYDTFNAKIDEIVAADSNTFKIETSDATMRDTNHWDYAGMKLISDRMIDAFLTTP